jgi:hypothetical protein
MSKFTFIVTGDEQVTANFNILANTSRARLKRALQFLGIGLAAHIQKTKLSGQRLHQRSGRLISSIHEETVEDDSGIITHVGTNVRYARPHEYGMHDSVTVKAHLREIKEAFGRPIAPVTVHVRAHPMKMNIGEKRFMRDSLEEFQPKIRAVMNKLAADIAKEATKK